MISSISMLRFVTVSTLVGLFIYSIVLSGYLEVVPRSAISNPPLLLAGNDVTTLKMQQTNRKRSYLKGNDQLPFVKNLKNPCWFETRPKTWSRSKENITSLKCLPYFLLVGQPKSGTTDLFSRISKHPHIIAPRIKGSNWWARGKIVGYDKKMLMKMISDKYSHEFDNLSHHLQTKCKVTSLQSVNISSCKHFITGDGSTSTFWDSSRTMNNLKKFFINSKSGKNILLNDLKRLRKTVNSSLVSDDVMGFKYTTADVIRMVLPDSRIIVILREPGERLYSDYKFFKRKKEAVSPEQFDSFVNESVALWNNCSTAYSDRYCAYDAKLHDSLKVRLHIGMYSIFLKDWMAIFPRQQILVLRTEDYRQNITDVITKVFRHLALRPLEKSTLRKITKTHIINVSRRKAGDMLPRTRLKLQSLYKKFNEELAALLQDKRYLWSYT